jgi:hypothetical protein
MSDLRKVILETLGRTKQSGSDQESIAEQIKGAIPYSSRGLEESLATVGRQLDQLRRVTQTQVEASGDNTQAVTENTQVQATKGGGSVGGEIARTASRVLGGGFALSPLLSGLLGLFRGSKPEPPPPLTPYARPTALHLDGAVRQEVSPPILPVDYGQDGLPRRTEPSGGSYRPQITVQVQAMDSRSFLDHSGEIARAVREAVLNAHSLNDVLSEM